MKILINLFSVLIIFGISIQNFFFNEELIISVSLILFFLLFIYVIRRLFLMLLYTEVYSVYLVFMYVFFMMIWLFDILLNIASLLSYRLTIQVLVNFMCTIMNMHFDFFKFEKFQFKMIGKFLIPFFFKCFIYKISFWHNCSKLLSQEFYNLEMSLYKLTAFIIFDAKNITKIFIKNNVS